MKKEDKQEKEIEFSDKTVKLLLTQIVSNPTLSAIISTYLDGKGIEPKDIENFEMKFKAILKE